MKNDIKSLLVQTLQKALNRYLALDPESRQRIYVLRGKIVKIDLVKIPVQFYLIFKDYDIQLKPVFSSQETKEEAEMHADTVIKGTPLRLFHMTLASETRQQFFSDDVSIEGNLELGQQVMNLFDHLEIDWEEILSRYIGDAPAHHLGRLGRKFKSWLDTTSETLLQNVNEYVHEEVDYFPARFALQDFFQDVDELRMDTDRLAARIDHLKNSIAALRGKK